MIVLSVTHVVVMIVLCCCSIYLAYRGTEVVGPKSVQILITKFGVERDEGRVRG